MVFYCGDLIDALLSHPLRVFGKAFSVIRRSNDSDASAVLLAVLLPVNMINLVINLALVIIRN